MILSNCLKEVLPIPVIWKLWKRMTAYTTAGKPASDFCWTCNKKLGGKMETINDR